MTKINSLFAVLSFVFAAQTLAQAQDFEWAPNNESVIQFKFSTLKKDAREMSGKIQQIYRQSGAQSGMVFAAQSRTQRFELALLNVSFDPNFSKIDRDETQVITCRGVALEGGYNLNRAAAGFNYSAKQVIYTFTDAKGRACEFRPGPIFSKMVRLVPTQTALILLNANN